MELPTKRTLTFVVGLPGSGKSPWIEQQAQGTDALVIHDFKARSHNDDLALHSSRHPPELIAAVESGRSSFIADIDFCRTASRNEAALFLARAFPGVSALYQGYMEIDVLCALPVIAKASQPEDRHCLQLHMTP